MTDSFITLRTFSCHRNDVGSVVQVVQTGGLSLGIVSKGG